MCHHKQYPSTPKSCDDAVTQLKGLHLPFLSNNNKHFYYVYPADGIVILTNSTNLHMLCDVDLVLGDGTFSYAPKHFAQVYTPHRFKNNFYIPLVFGFLPYKSTVTHRHVFQLLKVLCHDVCCTNLLVEYFSADFEKGAHNAVLAELLQCHLCCCAFHLIQVWFHRLQKTCTNFKQCEDQELEEGKWLKRLFGLSYLPGDEVEDTFSDLISVTPVIRIEVSAR